MYKRQEKQLRDVFDNPKICGAVLWINGPGGMVAHVDLAAKVIAESSKPVSYTHLDVYKRQAYNMPTFLIYYRLFLT